MKNQIVVALQSMYGLSRVGVEDEEGQQVGGGRWCKFDNNFFAVEFITRRETPAPTDDLNVKTHAFLPAWETPTPPTSRPMRSTTYLIGSSSSPVATSGWVSKLHHSCCCILRLSSPLQGQAKWKVRNVRYNSITVHSHRTVSR